MSEWPTCLTSTSESRRAAILVCCGEMDALLETEWLAAPGPQRLTAQDALAAFCKPNINPFYDPNAGNHKLTQTVSLRSCLLGNIILIHCIS